MRSGSSRTFFLVIQWKRCLVDFWGDFLVNKNSNKMMWSIMIRVSEYCCSDTVRIEYYLNSHYFHHSWNCILDFQIPRVKLYPRQPPFIRWFLDKDLPHINHKRQAKIWETPRNRDFQSDFLCQLIKVNERLFFLIYGLKSSGHR